MSRAHDKRIEEAFNQMLWDESVKVFRFYVEAMKRWQSDDLPFAKGDTVHILKPKRFQ